MRVEMWKRMVIPGRLFCPKHDMGASCGPRSYASAGLIARRPNLYIICR